MFKMTIYRKGRELLLNNNIIPGIVSFIKQNLELNNFDSILNGLTILENLL